MGEQLASFEARLAQGRLAVEQGGLAGEAGHLLDRELEPHTTALRRHDLRMQVFDKGVLVIKADDGLLQVGKFCHTGSFFLSVRLSSLWVLFPCKMLPCDPVECRRR